MTLVADDAVATGLIIGGGSVVKLPISLVFLPDSFVPIILKKYFVAGFKFDIAEAAVVKAPPFTVAGRTEATVKVAIVASVEYSKASEVAAFPGLTLILTTALWCVIVSILFNATSGATIGAPPSVGDTNRSLFAVPAGKLRMAFFVDSASINVVASETEAFGFNPK